MVVWLEFELARVRNWVSEEKRERVVRTF